MILKKFYCLFWLAVFTVGLNLSASDETERKWNKEGIPHHGWIHDDVEDLGVAEGVCDMCDKTHIRYIHTVSHDEHDSLRVGCICAEKMTKDYVNPKAREKAAKNMAAKRKLAERKAQERQQSWLNLDGWTSKKNGNYTKSLNNNWVTIFKKERTWKYVFNNQFSQGFNSAESARAAFVDNYIELIKNSY